MGKKLYVGNLNYAVTDAELEAMFAAHGTVQSAQVIMDRDTGRSKGFGFVEMGSEAEAQAAIQGLNDQDHNGRRLTVNEAILRGRMLDGEGLYWIEEPVRHDDYAGCARIAAELETPVQIGENLVDTFELVNALEARAMDYVMPDLQRIGGVTGWLRAAAITQAHGMEMSSHLFPEYSAHLLAVTPTAHWLEYMDWATPIATEPIQVKDGHLLIPDRPGSGITWNEDAVKRYAIV